MRRRLPNHAGFTLVEMLTVIAIISVLAAIIVPTYNSVQKKAAKANCASNLQQIGIAVKQYRMDRRKYPASLFEVAAGGYLTSAALVGCPEDEDDPGALTDSTEVRGRLTLTQSSYDSVALYPGQTGPIPVWNYFGYEWTDGNGNSQSDPGESEGVDTDTAQTLPAGARTQQLSNRNAPDSTIITHCIYHRDSLTAAPTADDMDIIVRLDGSVKDSVKPLNYDWLSQP